jgi:TPR repeat protein
MRDNPSRGVAFLQAAAEQNHLQAMGTLAMAYEKGRYRLAKDYRQSQMWYQKLLQAYDSGQYAGDVDERFIRSQRRRLEYVIKARKLQEDRARRYEQATALERQIMDIEDRYRIEYQKAVNRLNRGNGSKEGRKQFRAKVEQLRQHYARQRELEIEQIKHDAAGKSQTEK